MSSVRMCDKCGTVFSELEDGWQAFTGTTVKRGPNGEVKPISQALDACPSCALVPQQQFQRELEAAAEGDELQARIARLERENGMDPETGLFTEKKQPPVKKPSTATTKK